MIRALVVCCLIALALADKDSCTYKGKTYLKGDRFRDDCNRCFCAGNDKVGCTKMLCKPRHGDITPLEGNADTCEHKGKIYKKGDRFMDKCNHCFCGGNDMVGCTKMFCGPDSEDEIVLLKGNAESCDYKGKMYKKGDRFKDECNHCFCGGNDMVGCTRMLCRPRHDGEYEVAADYELTTCTHKGQTYNLGESFKDDCNKCFCGANGNIACTEMMCIHPGYQTSDDTESCSFKGQLYKKGENFKDDCNTCYCGGNGVIGCTLKMCIHPAADNYEAPTCTHKGKTYNLGDHFKDDCNRCFCGANGNVGCTRMMCIHPKDRTDYEMTTCTHKGKTFNLGDSFKDDCNRCFCGPNGHVGCTMKMCIHRNDYEASTCTHKGKTFNLGDSFKDDCNRCFCGPNGNVGCTMKMCIHRNKDPVPYADSETCTQNNKVYKKGDHFPSSDGCNTCFCGGNNMIGCTRKACLPKPKGCVHNGKFYKVGENYVDDCNRCMCTEAGGACTRMGCPQKLPKIEN